MLEVLKMMPESRYNSRVEIGTAHLDKDRPRPFPGTAGSGEDPLVRDQGPRAGALFWILAALVQVRQEGELALGGQGAACLSVTGGRNLAYHQQDGSGNKVEEALWESFILKKMFWGKSVFLNVLGKVFFIIPYFDAGVPGRQAKTVLCKN